MYQKIYGVDPFICPKCQGQMKILSIIDDFEIIGKILNHLNLWDIRNHDLPGGIFFRFVKKKSSSS